MPLFPSEPAGGAGTPGGSNTQVQFNNSSAFGGDAGFTYAGNGQATLALGTITTNLNALNITGTWNASGTTFDAPLLMNITNTASGANSLLMDLQVGGSTKFDIEKTGNIRTVGSVMIGTNGQIGAAGQLTTTSSAFFQCNAAVTTYNATIGVVGNGIFGTFSTGGFGFSSSGSTANTADTILTRGGAATFQLGLADAAAPVAQTIQAQSVVAGTTNTAGVNWTLKGSLSTGSGTSGDIILQTGGTGAGATAQNTSTTALTLKGGTQRTVCSAPLGMKGYTVATLPAGVTGDNAYVTDALAPSFLVTIAGGGSVVTPVFYNGTNWVGA